MGESQADGTRARGRCQGDGPPLSHRRSIVAAGGVRGRGTAGGKCQRAGREEEGVAAGLTAPRPALPRAITMP